MTIVVALSDGKKALIGADSACTTGTGARNINTINESKLFEFKNFVVGSAGEALIDEILLRMKESRELESGSEDSDDTVGPDWASFEINNKLDAADFARAVYWGLKHRCDGDEDIQMQMLIITNSLRIFVVDNVYDIREVKSFACIGAGAMPALGSLATFFANDPGAFITHKVINTALDIACSLTDGCSRPLESIAMTIDGSREWFFDA